MEALKLQNEKMFEILLTTYTQQESHESLLWWTKFVVTSLKWYKNSMKISYQYRFFRVLLKLFHKMKIFKIACICIKLVAGELLQSTPGDDESFLMFTRNYQLNNMMKRLSQVQKIALLQKLSNKDAARFRAKLRMLLYDRNGLYFEKSKPISTKAKHRSNRFTKYHRRS